MKKIVAFEWLSLDGFLAGPNGETDWFVWDEEVEAFAKEHQKGFDTLLFGRTTYETMAAYWPTPASEGEDKAITHFMNGCAKVVFSKSLQSVGWNNTRLVNDLTAEGIEKIKSGKGKDVIIYGSGSTVSQLLQLGLVDEIKVMLNPVLLGGGKPLFQDLPKTTLRLTETKPFANSCLLLTYTN